MAAARQGRCGWRPSRRAGEAIRLDPKYAQAHSNLGALYLEQKKYAEAITCARAAIQADPKLAIAYAMLGDLLVRAGEMSPVPARAADRSCTARQAMGIIARQTPARARCPGAARGEQVMSPDDGIQATNSSSRIPAVETARHMGRGSPRVGQQFEPVYGEFERVVSVGAGELVGITGPLKRSSGIETPCPSVRSLSSTDADSKTVRGGVP